MKTGIPADRCLCMAVVDMRHTLLYSISVSSTCIAYLGEPKSNQCYHCLYDR